MTILKKAVFTLFFLGFISPTFAQNELNDYKYIIVPKKYDFLKEEDQYLVNSYVRHLFKGEGYQVYYLGDAYPEDLEANICLGINAMVIDNSSMLTTKLVIAMVNCKGQTVFESIEGKSKLKDFNKTYRDALDKSFVSIQALNHEYMPSDAPASLAIEDKESSKEVSSAVPADATVAVPVVTKQAAEPEEKKDVPVKESSVVEPKSEVAAAAVVVPVVAEKPEESRSEVSKEASPAAENDPIVAKSYQNDNITFILINQGAQFQAYITKSNNDKYQAGEMVGTFEKTSLPNVFRVSWKKPERDVDETTAYFDDKGNLKIDIHRNGKLEVVTFTEVK